MACSRGLALVVALACRALAEAPSGSLYVSDFNVHSVHRFSKSGTYLGEFVKRRSGGLQRPAGMAFWTPVGRTNDADDVDPDVPSMVKGEVTRRHLYVASSGTDYILQYDGITGRFVRPLCHVAGRPHGITFHDSVLYVSSKLSNTISRFRASTGSPLGIMATGAPFAHLDGPWQIGHDGNRMLAASHNNQRLLQFAPDNLRKCTYAASPCSSTPVILSSAVGPISSFALGGESIYSTQPSGTITRLNRTTGALVNQFKAHEAPEAYGISYLRGHVFVTSSQPAIHRYNALTGESYGAWTASAMSLPNFLLWD